MQSIKFKADGVKLYPMTADGSIKVTLTTGEFEKSKLAQLFLIDSEKILNVTIEVE